MTHRAHRLYTVAEFEQRPESYERFELIDGEIKAKPMPKYEHSLIATLIRDMWKAFDPTEQRGTMQP